MEGCFLQVVMASVISSLAAINDHAPNLYSTLENATGRAGHRSEVRAVKAISCRTRQVSPWWPAPGQLHLLEPLCHVNRY